MLFTHLLTLVIGVGATRAGQKIILGNDDGWAQALIRAQNQALLNHGYEVILSCPANDKSGTGSSTDPTLPPVGSQGCQYQTCIPGSPGVGSDPANPRINYVNAFPADGARVGIQTLSPQIFGSTPDFFVGGPNYGHNAGGTVQISGTVGAAVQAIQLGVPAIAFSGSGSSVSGVPYWDLTDNPNSVNTHNQWVYANLSAKVVNAVLSQPPPYLPPGVFLNVNYATLNQNACWNVDDFSFIFTRVLVNSTATDAQVCDTTHLPDESGVLGLGCYATISVVGTSKVDVDATTQAWVHDRLSGFLSCLPKGLYCTGKSKANGVCSTATDCGDNGLRLCGSDGFVCLEGKCKKKSGVYCAADLNECLPGRTCVDGDPYLGDVYKHRFCYANDAKLCEEEYNTCLQDTEPQSEYEACGVIKESCLERVL